MGGAATSTHLKFLDDGLLEDLGRLGRLGRVRPFARPVAQLVEELGEVNLRLVAVGSGGARGELGGLKKKRCSMYRLCGWQNAPRAVREVCPSDWDTCDT